MTTRRENEIELGRIAATVKLRLAEQESMRQRGVVTFTMNDWKQYRDHAIEIRDCMTKLIEIREADPMIDIPDGFRSWTRIVRLLAKAKADERTADNIVEAITQATWSL